MKESLLHFVWQYRLFSTINLTTSDGEELEVIDVGILNRDEGPDFFNAKIKIGGTVWAGNVEIHVKASDWNKHQHKDNPQYDSIILHVVEQNDADIYRTNTEKIPCLTLNIPQRIKEQYKELIENKKWIPCADKLKQVPSIVVNSWKNALLIERLQLKTAALKSLLVATETHWEEVFYISLARSMGFSVNSQAFEMLAKSLPLAVLAHHKNDLFQVEALLFGQSGLLPEHSDEEYVLRLKTEYVHLKSKYNLNALNGQVWKFLRLRPDNFPTIRIAQFAAIIHYSNKLFSKVVDNPNSDFIRKVLSVVPSEYWYTHYLFGESSASKQKKIGDLSLNGLIINTVVPLLFLYGTHTGNDTLKNKSLEVLETLPAEKNSIIAGWQNAGMLIESAYDSQAYIHLKRNYCELKKCMQCRIGHKILTI